MLCYVYPIHGHIILVQCETGKGTNRITNSFLNVANVQTSTANEIARTAVHKNTLPHPCTILLQLHPTIEQTPNSKTD